MRNIIRLAGLSALAAVSFAGTAHAAGTATATASAEVLSTLAVTKTADIAFGSIAVNADGTYILGADGTYSCTAGLVCSGTRNPAAFTVTGSATTIGVVASVVQPSIVLTHTTDSTKTFTLSNFTTHFPSGSSLVSGSTAFNIGGTLALTAANALQGTYSGSFDVTVEYQ